MFIKLRLLLTSLVVLTATITASSQTIWQEAVKSKVGTSFRVLTGLNLSHFTHADRWDGTKAGFNIGVMAEKPVYNSISAKVGLFYTMKGAVGKNDGGFGGTLTTTFSPSYLEIPVLASSRYVVNDNVSLEFDLGPYFAFGLHGKDVKKYSANGSFSKPTKTEIELFGKDGQLKRFDFGFRFGVGAVLENNFSAGLAYETSMVNISEMGGKIGNGNFMINLGYKFYTF